MVAVMVSGLSRRQAEDREPSRCSSPSRSARVAGRRRSPLLVQEAGAHLRRLLVAHRVGVTVEQHPHRAVAEGRAGPHRRPGPGPRRGPGSPRRRSAPAAAGAQRSTSPSASACSGARTRPRPPYRNNRSSTTSRIRSATRVMPRGTRLCTAPRRGTPRGRRRGRGRGSARWPRRRRTPLVDLRPRPSGSGSTSSGR